MFILGAVLLVYLGIGSLFLFIGERVKPVENITTEGLAQDNEWEHILYGSSDSVKKCVFAMLVLMIRLLVIFAWPWLLWKTFRSKKEQ